jgi:hypothetical protein
MFMRGLSEKLAVLSMYTPLKKKLYVDLTLPMPFNPCSQWLSELSCRTDSPLG